MSSEKFESIEDDVRSVSEEIKLKIDKLSKLWGEEKKKLVREIEKQIEETYYLLQELEREAQNAPHPFRSQMLGKVRNFTGVVNKYRDKLNNIDGNDYRSRPDPYGGQSQGASSDINKIENFQRVRLLQTNEVLGRTTTSIDRMQCIAAETDNIGNEIIGELEQQRDSLVRTKERLTDTDANLSKSRKLLRLMYKRVMTNKLILVLIILMEIAILIGVVYWKFFSSK